MNKMPVVIIAITDTLFIICCPLVGAILAVAPLNVDNQTQINHASAYSLTSTPPPYYQK